MTLRLQQEGSTQSCKHHTLGKADTCSLKKVSLRNQEYTMDKLTKQPLACRARNLPISLAFSEKSLMEIAFIIIRHLN